MSEKRNNDEAPLSEYQQIAAELRGLNEGVQAPEAFRTGWRAAVEKEANQMKKSGKSHRFPRRGRYGAAAVAAAIFLVGGTMLTRALQPGLTSSPQADVSSSYSSYSSGASPRLMAAANSSAGDLVMMDEVGSAAPANATESTAQRQIILRTASVSLNTTNYENDLNAILTAMQQYGGWAEYQSASGEADSRRASMTLRIPADRLDDFLADVKQIGSLKNLETSAQDVSANYYDTESRKAIYEAQRERLTELLAQAEDVADIIEIENSLADLQYKIENLQGSLNRWDSYSETSVVNLTLREIAVSEDKQETGLLARLGDAVKTSLREAGEFFSDMLIFLVLALPYLAAAAAVTAIAALCVRRHRRRRALKNEFGENE